MATIKKAQTGKALPPKPKKKTGMDAVKALGKYVSTFGGATERDNPKQKDINIVKKLKETGTKVKNKLGLKSGGVMKKKMKNGGSLSGLTASNKRDKGTDVGGDWTKVQKKTLAGAKGKAKLTKDKQLGATKMTAKKGMKISKKK